MTLNLISGAWIPVRRADGTRDVIRPAQITESLMAPAGTLASNYVTFPDWPRPDLNIATLEWLIGLMSVALPPSNHGAWITAWKTPPDVAALDAAFAPLASAFNLDDAADGTGPRFLQDFDELVGDPVGIGALLIDSAGESTAKKNADLMVKRQRYSCLSRPAAAIALYALQQFAPSGGAGHRTSMRGGGPMTTLALPPRQTDKPTSLWQIIWANVSLADDDFEPAQLAKIFPWLAATLTSEKGQEIHRSDPRVHLLQAFFGMPRRIRLRFEANETQTPCDLTGVIDDVVVNGYVARTYGVNYGQWRHPLTPYYCKKEGDQEHFATHPTPGRFGYRNWVSLVLGNKDKTRLTAETIRNFKERVHDAPGQFKDADANLLIAGWAMSNAKPLDFIYAEQPLHLAHDDAHRAALDDLSRRLVEAAQRAAGMLVGAVQSALQTGKDKPDAKSTKISAVREAFFADTEDKFHELLSAAARRPDITPDWHLDFARAWLRELQVTAFYQFDATIEPSAFDPEKARRIVEARRRLTTGLLYGKGDKSLPGILNITLPNKPKKSKTTGAPA